MRKHIKGFIAGVMVGGLALAPMAAGALSSPSHIQVEVVTWANGSKSMVVGEGSHYTYVGESVCNGVGQLPAKHFVQASTGHHYVSTVFYGGKCFTPPAGSASAAAAPAG